MKKYPKLIQCDQRGQIVIPKDVRDELELKDGSGFWVYSIGKEGILLKKVDPQPLKDEPIIKELEQKAEVLQLNKQSINTATEEYRVGKRGKLKEI